MAEFTRDTPMPFGKFKGTPLKDVPADYLICLEGNMRRDSYRDFQKYVKDNWDALQSEAKQNKNK